LGTISYDRLAAHLAVAAGLPPAWTQASRAVEWHDNGLVRRLVVSPLKHDTTRVNWWVELVDERLRVADGPRVALTIGVTADVADVRQRIDEGYPRPTTPAKVDPDMVEDIRRYAPDALAFVADRAELGRIMLGDKPRRGNLEDLTWFPGSRKLIQAVMVARDTGDRALEAEALAGGAALADLPLTGPGPKTYRELFEHNAMMWNYHGLVDLTDLFPKGKRSTVLQY